jgi:hypothetical protein
VPLPQPSSLLAQPKSAAVPWALIILTALVLAIHGFHPLAEDGGLYVAGIKWLLHPALFPHDTAFVREHLRFSLFAPAITTIVRLTHIPLLWTLLLLYLATTFATLYAARELLRALGFSNHATLAGITLLAACWTMPIAATSLMLMDPYLTARSFATPLALLALAYALRNRTTPALALIAIAVAFHPLMAGYGLAFVVALYLTRSRNPRTAWLILTAITLAAAATLQAFAKPDTPAEAIAAASRYYWFLSQWHWYEDLGLLGPIAVLLLLRTPQRKAFIHAITTLAALATLTALLFAQEHFRAHIVASLQPLRIFLELYALMLLLLGATIAERTKLHALPWLLAATAAIAFAFVARSTYPCSPQVEWPWAADHQPNPWVQAFLWAKHNTPPTALFALDAKYVNRDGEDAQVFRAIAERSALPDYSKDGGEVSIAPALAATWLPAAQAQKDLDQQSDASRDLRLAPFHPDFVILNAATATSHPCPYRNAVVKVCALR